MTHLEYLKISFIKYIGVKFILDPSRYLFKKKSDGDYEAKDFKFLIRGNNIIIIWYSLLGFIFSSIFIVFAFGCDFESGCDQDADRISRFGAFSIFSLVIHVLAVVYSLASGCSAGCYDKTFFQPASPEELREEETNV